ncbi:AMP-binding protein [Piscibacillus salipiscarius]|uniref:AMP-binding protein n=1 Tax=Piscibacillus salipiscarius TaxID=299480 RepID=UPI000AF9505E|nr:AMP-binding protein [Piscibacillus salipiscarius]
MKPNNLVEMLDRTVKKHPNKDAFMWKEGGAYKRITYKDFWSRMMHAAAGFGYLGLKANDKVALLSNSNPMWGMTDFASASIGAVSVPIYPTLPSEQINYILNNADVKAIVVENEEQRQKVLNTHSNVEWIITMYPDNQSSYDEGELSFAQLLKYGKEHALPKWENQWRQINRDHLSTIIHTSGTTGMPKGVMLTHGNFLANIEGVQFWLIELLPEDLSLSYLPLSHVFERMAGHYMPLSVGTTMLMQKVLIPSKKTYKKSDQLF